MVLKWCSRRVFAVFKSIERSADRVTGAVGPMFVGLAAILLSGGAFACFEVILSSGEPSILNYVMSAVWALYIIISIGFHYYISICVPPGSPRPHPPMITITDASSFVEDQQEFETHTTISNRISSHDDHDMMSNYYLASLPPFAKFLTTTVVPRLTIDKHCIVHNNNNSSNSSIPPRQILAPAVIVTCKKCLALRPNMSASKPERFHHCRVCKTCCLKYDHHCPWINQCVGYQNERSFLLFMIYLCVGCLFMVAWGWPSFKHALDFWNVHPDWSFYTPRLVVVLVWVFSIAIGPAVGIMAAWQIYLIARGETTVEAQDNEYYKKTLQASGEVFINVFDLGYRRNLAVFFSLDSFPWWTIFLPLPFPPQGDGWKWEKVEGWEKYQIDNEDQLTDGESD